MAPAVIATKLYIPPLRPGALARADLIARLNAGLQRRLTLISAPAGFGKTTLASRWAAGCGRPAAWLSLDRADNDPARFLAHLVAALQSIAPALGAAAAAALQSPLPALLNEIAAQPAPMLLLLDDCHVLEAEAVLQALATLVEYMPPQLHIAIASRDMPALPLARLRARGQLSELHAADMRLRPAEAAEFLNMVMGLALSAEQIAALEERAEGWIAGLQLAALSLQQQSDVASAIRSFTGSHRFVLDYLVEEVLSAQPDAIQQFLLRSSALDRMCGPLCDALLGSPPGQATLEALERANLFIFPLDSERRWYRYHQLFADALRQRLAASAAAPDIAGLHIRASAWFESQGLQLEAFQHAAAAGDTARIARLAEQSWQRMDRSFQLATWLGWVAQVPPAVLQARPVLSAQYAWALMDAGDLERSEAHLRDAERCLAAAGAGAQQGPAADTMVVVDAEQFRALPAMIAFARAYHAQARGDVAAAVGYARLALEQAPESHAVLRAQAAVLLGVSAWASGEMEAAYGALDDWVQQMRRAGNRMFALVAIFGLIEIRVAQGRLADAVAEYRQAQRFAGDQRQAMSYLAISDALLRLEAGDRAGAAACLEEIRAQGAQSPFIDWSYRWHVARARVYQAEEQWAAALSQLDAANRAHARTPVPEFRPVAAIGARIDIRQGQLGRARAWARERGIGAQDALSYLHEYEYLTLARLLIAEYAQHRAAPALADAQALLARLLGAAGTGGRAASAIEILALQALAHAAQGGQALALVPLGRALELAGQGGYVQLFANEGPPMARLIAAALAAGSAPAFARRLLAAFPGAAPPATALAADDPAPFEPLSEREREVLALIADGLSNHQIAARLVLSPLTIKVHVRNIFAKLGVTNRTHAVARGRALGMLSRA